MPSSTHVEVAKTIWQIYEDEGAKLLERLKEYVPEATLDEFGLYMAMYNLAVQRSDGSRTLNAMFAGTPYAKYLSVSAPVSDIWVENVTKSPKLTPFMVVVNPNSHNYMIGEVLIKSTKIADNAEFRGISRSQRGGNGNMVHYRGLSWPNLTALENFMSTQFNEIGEGILETLIPCKPERLNEWF